MTRIKWLGARISVLAMGLVSCGGGEPSAAVVGLWRLDRADGCLVLLRVTEDERCGWGVACELQSGEIGLERHVGQCTLDDGLINATWTESTCEAPQRLRSRYTVDGDQLALEGSDGRLLFRRLDEDSDGMPATAAVRFGCWEGDTLVFSELHPL
jgi:hypothetical protein